MAEIFFNLTKKILRIQLEYKIKMLQQVLLLWNRLNTFIMHKRNEVFKIISYNCGKNSLQKILKYQYIPINLLNFNHKMKYFGNNMTNIILQMIHI